MAKQSKKQEGKLQKVEPARVVTPFEDMERFFDNVFSRGPRSSNHCRIRFMCGVPPLTAAEKKTPGTLPVRRITSSTISIQVAQNIWFSSAPEVGQIFLPKPGTA